MDSASIDTHYWCCFQCDSNGDLEQLEETGTNLETLRKSIMSSKRMLYTFTHGTKALRDAEMEDHEVELKRLESESRLSRMPSTQGTYYILYAT